MKRKNDRSSEQRLRSVSTDHVPLLAVALLHPAQLRQRQFSGDGGGQRELVVGTRGSLQLQTCGQTEVSEHSASDGALLSQDSLSPLMPKLQASSADPCADVTLTSRQSSSRDQLLTCATY